MPKAIHPADFGFFSVLVSSGSLSAAARELGITVAAVSKRLSLMESRLGLALVNRTSRRMSLTPEGETYLERARAILGEIDDLEGVLRGAAETPRGLLRINATLGFGRGYVAPLVSRFIALHPEVDAQLQLSVAPPPISDDTYDVCVRFGPPPDSRIVARLLAKNRRILCASPGYVRKFGEPRSPEELVKHNCIGIRQGDDYTIWRFASHRAPGRGSREGEHHVRVRGNLATNDGGIAVSWALEGRGILLRAEWDVARYVERGTLVRLLPGYDTPNADIYAVYPQQHRSSTRVKAFVEFLAASFDGKTDSSR